AMGRILGSDGLGAADAALLCCFAAMLPWNVIGFWNALIGFTILFASRHAPALVVPALRSAPARTVKARLAVVMPIYNEEPERVVRHLAETVSSLQAAAGTENFTVFLLSDTQDSARVTAEAAAFAAWQRRAGFGVSAEYRRRMDNYGHKTGNLWDFLERRGRDFDLLLVLDADSVMSGASIVRLAQTMEAHPEIGILQQLIVGLPSLSPFARIFQFGMRHGMRAYTVGSAWWQGDCGPYWGHNAIIRIAPFMEHCRLPTLPGQPPLGGRILSHDQVEAVLMRRAGWQVRVLPEEEGSYEENPPTLSDFVKRDLRWCQGNWQYLQLVGRPGLHLLGRLQLVLAMLMYVSGPAWILFSLVGFGRAFIGTAALGPPAGPGAPLLGQPAAWEPWALLATTMVMVFAPKLAGVAQVLASPKLRRAYGGGWRMGVSSLVELAFSFVLAPIMAVAQTRFVLGLAAGRTIYWDAQLRDSRALPWGEAGRGLWPQTVLALVLGVAVWFGAPASARLWVFLFCGPLLLSIPFAVVTSWVSLGSLLARHGICAVPEEIDPPPVVVAAGHALGPTPRPGSGAAPGFVAIDVPAAPSVD
ncbi:MAG: glucans biosynthesis glucosyltransferase MdoH, partial [Geminicoccaceae bacterium]